MQNNVKLTVTFVLLFSLQGFSQTTEKSEHPLLDKYYPRAQNTDTSKALTNQIKPVPETKPAPAGTITPAVAITPAIITSVPDVTPTSAITTAVPALTTTSAMTTTTAINKPAIVTAQLPVKKVQTQPAPPLYNNMRLGSSTKQYDTWEKNKNGAGSVTTSPK